MPQAEWEYRVLRLSPRAGEEHVEAALNELGAEGWELVGIVQLVTQWKSGPRVAGGLALTGFSDQLSETLVHRAYFKRRRSSELLIAEHAEDAEGDGRERRG